jgi:ankyrin repeat protein
MEPEIKQATRLLQAQRAVDRDEQPLSWIRNRLSSQAGTTYTAREVNKVLAEVVEADGSVGVVKALLALGADVNFARRRHSNTWNKITQRNSPGERSNILLRAVIRCRPETVHAIAAHADQANLDSVLHHAIARGNLAVLAALLEHGASPLQLHDDFQEVVFHDNLELLKVLLSGHHLPCLACRSTGLRIAVENRSLEAVRLLLDHWADVNYGDAIALTRAVEISRPDLVALLISGPVQPSSRSLDAAVGKLRQFLTENDNKLNREMLELCLSAGATGPETMRLVTEGLVELVRRRHLHLIGTILRHKKPPGQYEAAALIEAVRSEQLEVVTKLLEFKPAPETLSVGISQAVGVGSPQFRYEATRLLIASGAQGPRAAEALVKTVHCLVANLRRGDKMSIERDMRLFYLLLHEGKADVNFGKGEALQIAVRAASVEVAEEILAKEPSADSLGTALTWAMNVRDEQKKRLLVEMLVRRQVNEDAAGKALVALLKTEPANA